MLLIFKLKKTKVEKGWSLTFEVITVASYSLRQKNFVIQSHLKTPEGVQPCPSNEIIEMIKYSQQNIIKFRNGVLGSQFGDPNNKVQKIVLLFYRVTKKIIQAEFAH